MKTLINRGARKRPATALLAGLWGLGSVLGLATAGPAHAQDYIDLTQVCKNQYNQPAAVVQQVDGNNDAYSYECVLPYLDSYSAGANVDRGGPGVSAGINFGGGQRLGGLDVQGWCNKYMAGLPATAWEGSNQWTCGDGSVSF